MTTDSETRTYMHIHTQTHIHTHTHKHADEINGLVELQRRRIARHTHAHTHARTHTCARSSTYTHMRTNTPPELTQQQSRTLLRPCIWPCLVSKRVRKCHRISAQCMKSSMCPLIFIAIRPCPSVCLCLSIPPQTNGLLRNKAQKIRSQVCHAHMRSSSGFGQVSLGMLTERAIFERHQHLSPHMNSTELCAFVCY